MSQMRIILIKIMSIKIIKINHKNHFIKIITNPSTNPIGIESVLHIFISNKISNFLELENNHWRY